MKRYTMENQQSNSENIEFHRDIITAYNNILTEIDFLVEGSLVFNEPGDPRKITLDKFLYNLKHNMDAVIKESIEQYDIRQEVETRFREVEVHIGCDECGSEVDTRVGIMKWHDEKPATPEDWDLLEKFNDFLEIPVRWVTYCTNPNCGKMWKEGEFEEEIVLPKTCNIKDKIKAEVLRERGLQ